MLYLRSMGAVVLGFLLILQVASYASYNQSPQSVHGDSASTKPESLIGKGYIYDLSLQIISNQEGHYVKQRISSTVSKYDAKTDEFTLKTVVQKDFDGQKEAATYETVVNHDPFSNAEISRQYWMSALKDSLERTQWNVDLHDVVSKLDGSKVIEMEGSKYIGVVYETQATLDLTYPAYIPTKVTLYLGEKDTMFSESGLVYQADANLSNMQKDSSLSITYHAVLVKSDVAPGRPFSTQNVEHETITVNAGSKFYPIILVYGDDTTLKSKNFQFDQGYFELSYGTLQYAKEVLLTISVPKQLQKDMDLSFSSLVVKVDGNEHSFTLTSSDLDMFINVRDLPSGDHTVRFSFASQLQGVKQEQPEKNVPEQSNSPFAKYRQAGNILIQSPVQINLVMFGDTLDANEIQKNLLGSYKPMILSQNRSLGVEFVYNYNFINEPQSVSDELFSFIDSIAVDKSNDIPVSLIEWLHAKYKTFEVLRDQQGSSYLHCITTEQECKQSLPYGADSNATCVYTACELHKLNYKWIDASAVEEWFHKKGITSEGYTIFFMHPSLGHMSYLHTYGIVTSDADRGEMFTQDGMMGFGGKYRFYFIDLTAGPSFYPEVPIPSFATIFHKNIFDTENKQDYQKLVTGYINNAIVLLFTPSYLYEPTYTIKYTVDVLIVDQTTGRAFATIAPQYLTNSRLESAMKSLAPYAQWKFNVEGKSFDWMDHELARAFVKSMKFGNYEGIRTTSIDSKTLQFEFYKWATSNATAQQKEVSDTSKGDTLRIPVIILVLDAFSYIDDGSLGLAMPDITDPRSPCCVLIVAQKDRLLDFNAGLTGVTVHEVAHILGLMHPHDGYREDVKGGWFQDWFFDWSSTSMTYASPMGFGCRGLVQDASGVWVWKKCGMALSGYNQFNYDTFDRGVILHLLKQSFANINETLDILQSKGYGDNLPPTISDGFLSIDKDIDSIKQEFTKMDYSLRATSSLPKQNGSDTAMDLALRTLTNTEELVKHAGELKPFVQKQEEQAPTPPTETKEEKVKPPQGQNLITVNMKVKKNSILLAVKNAGDQPVYSIKIKAADGKIKFVKARGWDREKVDPTTVMVKSTDRPLLGGQSLIVVLVIDNKASGIEWTAYNARSLMVSSGALIPK